MADSKIFVIDDDAVARDLLRDALVKEGYDVEAFEGGAQAIQRGKETKVDLVLTDAHCFHNHHVLAHGIHHSDDVAGGSGQTTHGAAGRQ